MRQKQLACLMALMVFASYADDNSPMAKLTFRVTDSLGTPVTNAEVGVSFYLWSEKPSGAVGKTDTNGLFTAEGFCSVDANCSFVKDGYYLTSYRHAFPNPRRDSSTVKDGKWQPWNPTIEITLKEKRNPIPMYVKKAKVFLPKKGEPFGFDCEMDDLVEPFGKGRNADITFIYTAEIEGFKDLCYSNQVVISGHSEYGGIIKKDADLWSQLVSLQEAPVSGYQPDVTLFYHRSGAQIKGEMGFKRGTYLIFRSRIKTDEEGQIVSVNYGKIYPPFDYGEAPENKGEGRVEFYYYFNPTPNDTSLEFDFTKNLSNSRDRIPIP